MSDIQKEQERIIGILQDAGLLCSGPLSVCTLSSAGLGCSCGQIMTEIRQ